MVGKSAEGRELKVIKICRDGCGKKPIIFIEGGEKKRVKCCWGCRTCNLLNWLTNVYVFQSNTTKNDLEQWQWWKCSLNKNKNTSIPGIHAREWISPAAATYVLSKLTDNVTKEEENMGDLYDWFDFHLQFCSYTVKNMRMKFIIGTSCPCWTLTGTSTPGRTTGCGGRTGWERLDNIMIQILAVWCGQKLISIYPCQLF